MKKTALIITYYKADNYGAFLQAFAMQEYLSSIGIESEIFSYESKSGKIIKTLYKIKSKLNGSIHIGKENQQYHKEMLQSVLNYQSKLKFNHNKKKYDVVIIGSDEIWNVKNIGADHDSFFFSKSKIADKTISYAACSGNSELNHFKLYPFSLRSIKKLDCISVRDDNTERIIKSIGRNDVIRVLDPTFLIDFNKYLPKKSNSDKYLFVYSYGLSETQSEQIKIFAKKHNLKIVATGFFCKWADYNPVPNPFEWIMLLKDAEFVITSTFHGTVFSIQQRKPFAVYNSDSPKINSILKETNLLTNRITDWNTIDEIYKNFSGYNRIETLLKNKIQYSKDFLNSIFFNKTFCQINNENPFLHHKCYIARHKNKEIRWNSRSGGVFTALSDLLLDKGGIVYGAVLQDDFSVSHIRASTKKERDKMRGSKYVQSNLINVLPLIKKDLLENKIILFSGTPCQVDAIRLLAEKIGRIEYLYSVDFICHGVPSPKVWRDYINSFDNVISVDFRNKKKYGWGEHIETISTNNKQISQKLYTNLYYNNYITRPCCHECPYAQYKHFSDITIGDCWGVEKLAPGFNADDSGASMCFSNTEKGKILLEKALLSMDYIENEIGNMMQPIMKAQGMGIGLPNKRRSDFWKDYTKKNFEDLCAVYLGRKSINRKIGLPHYIRFLIKKILHKN